MTSKMTRERIQAKETLWKAERRAFLEADCVKVEDGKYESRFCLEIANAATEAAAKTAAEAEAGACRVQ